MTRRALFVGNSDGIGLAATRKLLAEGWDVVGVSRSRSPISHPSYEHTTAEVQKEDYPERLDAVLCGGPAPDLCVYCVGIGELLDLDCMGDEPEVFEVNLVGLVKTVSAVLPLMVARGGGHLVGLSSLADELLSAEAPSYHASKAGVSSYLEGLARATREKGVHITNLRFGFVDTKMAKGDVKPLMMSVERAAEHLLTCIARKPVRYTAPRAAIPLVKLRRLLMWMRLA